MGQSLFEEIDLLTGDLTALTFLVEALYVLQLKGLPECHFAKFSEELKEQALALRLEGADPAMANHVALNMHRALSAILDRIAARMNDPEGQALAAPE